MRKYTLVFSIFAHALAVGALIIVPALATDDLPEPRRTTAYIEVRPVLPPPPAPVRERPREAPSTTNAAPLTPPEMVQPETIVEPVDPAAVDPGTLQTGIPIGDIISTGDPIPPPPPPPPPRVKEPVRAGGLIQPKKVYHVTPIYPPIALAARKERIVILEALIAEDGTVRNVRLLRSEPLLDDAAITAVRQWRFTPTILNGEPVPIVMTVTVGFTLTK